MKGTALTEILLSQKSLIRLCVQPELIKAVGVAHSNRPQDVSVEHSEQRSIQPQPEGDRRDDCDGEYRRPSKTLQRVTEVVIESFHYIDPPRVTALLFDPLDSAEIHLRL